jgi:hypothetical protein
VETGRAFHENRGRELTHKELFAVVRVRNENNIAVVAHRTQNRNVVVVIVVVVVVVVSVRRFFENAFFVDFAEDLVDRADDLRQ